LKPTGAGPKCGAKFGKSFSKSITNPTEAGAPRDVGGREGVAADDPRDPDGADPEMLERMRLALSGESPGGAPRRAQPADGGGAVP